jgi:hypothetical protein
MLSERYSPFKSFVRAFYRSISAPLCVVSFFTTLANQNDFLKDFTFDNKLYKANLDWLLKPLYYQMSM